MLMVMTFVASPRAGSACQPPAAQLRQTAAAGATASAGGAALDIRSGEQ